MADEVKIDITIEEKQALQALTKLTRGVDKFEDSAKESFAGATKAFDVFKGALASAVVVKGFEAAGRAASAFFNTFVTEGIDAAHYPTNYTFPQTC